MIKRIIVEYWRRYSPSNLWLDPGVPLQTGPTQCTTCSNCCHLGGGTWRWGHVPTVWAAASSTCHWCSQLWLDSLNLWVTLVCHWHHVCVSVCVCACMHVCVHGVCMCGVCTCMVCVCVCMHAHVRAWCVYVRVCACMVCIHAHAWCVCVCMRSVCAHA